MTATVHERSEEYRQVRVLGGDISELLAVVRRFADEGNAQAGWYVEGEALVLEHPALSSLVGGEDYLEAEDD